jgi:hypothetical protein
MDENLSNGIIDHVILFLPDLRGGMLMFGWTWRDG